MPNIAISATGLLRDFSDAGVLGLADVHLARTLATLGGDETQQVALAVALTMRAWRTGSPCLDIRRADALGADADAETTPDVAGLTWPQPDAWLAQLQASPLVGTAHDQRPLCLDGHLLYLRRTWQDQATVVSSLGQRWRAAAPVPPVGPTGDAVVDAVLSQWTYVLTGGPGTGKTTAVARVVDHVRQLPGLGRIAIAAPTGKAAARLAQALTQSSLQPTTVHRLLGARGPGRGFRHDANNPLPADLVIVDELSMVSLPLMAALLDALRPTARLLLVGDPGQLASVEAGAVLADLVAANVTASAHGDAPLVGHLTHVYRHRGALADLSIAAGSGDVDAAMAVLRRGDATATLIDADAHNLTWDDLPQVAGDIKTTAAQVRQAAEAGNAALALSSLDGHRLLCAHRQGPYGVATWARRAAELTTPPGRRSDDWWPGRAVLATATAPDIGVVSGAQGVVVEGPGQVRLAFDASPNDADTTATPQLLPTDAVPGLATLDAMTVHKSQGSEFASVTVVVPPTESPLLIRPLLYTAMTRARQRLTLIGTRQQVRQGLATVPQRTSGLAQQLQKNMNQH